MTDTLDALIIGGGPAGCAAASLLTDCGHTVRVIDRPATGRAAVAESLPPSARKILSAVGLWHAVEEAGFQPWTGNTVWWADREARVETFAPGTHGFQIERGHFDQVLRLAAARAGAPIEPGVVRDVDDAGTATIEHNGAVTRVTARFVLDCSGRAGVLARKGQRELEPSLRTVALSGAWRAATPWPSEQRGQTLVASYADGWAWSVPVTDDVRHVTVMVDPERTHLTRGASALSVYRAELAKVAPFAPWLGAATLVGGPWGRDASPYSARQYAGATWLLVGDAGAAIDPLSSFGVKKALASAWLAGIAVHTALATPPLRDEALAFFDRREREVHAALQRQAATFAMDAAAHSQHRFWLARASSVTAGGVAPTDAMDASDPVDPAALARDPDVLAALAELQQRPVLAVRAGANARVVRAASVRGREIVMDDHLVVPAWPGGIRYIRNIDLLLLRRLALEHRDVGELFVALSRQQPGVSLPDVLGALATLVARGALTW